LRPSFWSRWEIGDVRYEVQSGKYMLALSFSVFDPTRTSNLIAFCGLMLSHTVPATYRPGPLLQAGIFLDVTAS